MIQGLGCEGQQVSDRLWRVLTKRGHFRTAAEETQKRFEIAEIASSPETRFGIEVCRLIKACFKRCRATETFDVAFVAAGDLDMHVLLSQEHHTIRIHGKWLSPDRVRDAPGIDDEDEYELIWQTSTQIFSDVLAQLAHAAFELEPEKPTKVIRAAEKTKARRRVRRATDFMRSLKLDWIGPVDVLFEWESKHWFKPEEDLEVHLHDAETCLDLRSSTTVAEREWAECPGPDDLDFTGLTKPCCSARQSTLSASRTGCSSTIPLANCISMSMSTPACRLREQTRPSYVVYGDLPAHRIFRRYLSPGP